MDDAQTKKETEKALMRLALSTFAEMTVWIAGPIVGALYLGRYLDQKYETANLYFLSLTGLAFIISCVGISLVGMKYLKQINKEDNNQVEQNSSHDRRR